MKTIEPCFIFFQRFVFIDRRHFSQFLRKTNLSAYISEKKYFHLWWNFLQTLFPSSEFNFETLKNKRNAKNLAANIHHFFVVQPSFAIFHNERMIFYVEISHINIYIYIREIQWKRYRITPAFLLEMSIVVENGPLPHREDKRKKANVPLPWWWLKKCFDFYDCEYFGVKLLLLIDEIRRVSLFRIDEHAIFVRIQLLLRLPTNNTCSYGHLWFTSTCGR